MKIKQLRLVEGIHALKTRDSIMASKDDEIERMATGDYLVTPLVGDPVIIPRHMVKFAVCVREPLPQKEYAAGKVPVGELKK